MLTGTGISRRCPASPRSLSLCRFLSWCIFQCLSLSPLQRCATCIILHRVYRHYPSTSAVAVFPYLLLFRFVRRLKCLTATRRVSGRSNKITVRLNNDRTHNDRRRLFPHLFIQPSDRSIVVDAVNLLVPFFLYFFFHFCFRYYFILFYYYFIFFLLQRTRPYTLR